MSPNWGAECNNVGSTIHPAETLISAPYWTFGYRLVITILVFNMVQYYYIGRRSNYISNQYGNNITYCGYIAWYQMLRVHHIGGGTILGSHMVTFRPSDIISALCTGYDDKDESERV